MSVVMELQERGDALNKLEKALQLAFAGDGRFLLISGEAGIGKTSLVEQFIAGPHCPTVSGRA